MNKNIIALGTFIILFSPFAFVASQNFQKAAAAEKSANEAVQVEKPLAEDMDQLKNKNQEN